MLNVTKIHHAQPKSGYIRAYIFQGKNILQTSYMTLYSIVYTKSEKKLILRVLNPPLSL